MIAFGQWMALIVIIVLYLVTLVKKPVECGYLAEVAEREQAVAFRLAGSVVAFRGFFFPFRLFQALRLEKEDDHRHQAISVISGVRRANCYAKTAICATRFTIVLAPSFETLAREWYEFRQPHWKPVHANYVITTLERYMLPMIGPTTLTGIIESPLLAVEREVEVRVRLRQRTGLNKD